MFDPERTGRNARTFACTNVLRSRILLHLECYFSLEREKMGGGFYNLSAHNKFNLTKTISYLFP